ncbi:MAG TPA: hypothetical protein VFL03_04550 [Candidatus Limnocylindrales bacterium]|jgi:putative hemolysin|nr:hypothetical protein [Candidatus Limnocylindrales bacterium]
MRSPRSRLARRLGAIVVLAVVVVTGCGSTTGQLAEGSIRPSLVAAASAAAESALATEASASESPTAEASPASGGTSSAEQYCTDKGGILTPRRAAWNTNQDESAWLLLATTQTFCEFTDGTGDSETRISVDLTTLSSETPTLAAIAYLSRIRTTSPPQASANPAEYSCQNDFDGATYFGNSAAGGGWTDPSQPVFVVMIPCTFADGSSIDAFGLWYHANGVIRGADLAPLMAYQPGNDLPAVYASEGR